MRRALAGLVPTPSSAASPTPSPSRIERDPYRAGKVRETNSHELGFGSGGGLDDDDDDDDEDDGDDAGGGGTGNIAVCRPWSRPDFEARVRTFIPARWFAPPASLSPMRCARDGWCNVDVDTLGCPLCGNQIVYSGRGGSFLGGGSGDGGGGGGGGHAPMDTGDGGESGIAAPGSGAGNGAASAAATDGEALVLHQLTEGHRLGAFRRHGSQR